MNLLIVSLIGKRVSTRKKLPSVDVGPTALAWLMTFNLICDIDLQFPASYGHDWLAAKVQGQ